jgi:hypothetical protein
LKNIVLGISKKLILCRKQFHLDKSSIHWVLKTMAEAASWDLAYIGDIFGLEN